MKTPRLIAHRGARSEAPENTICAFEKAARLDVECIEMDVVLCADNVPVLIHQETVMPDPGFSYLQLAERDEARSWVQNYTAQELSRLDAGRWFGPEFSNERIPLFEHVLKREWHGKKLMLDLIDPDYWRDENSTILAEKFSKTVFPLIAVSKQKVKFIGFSPHMLRALRQSIPNADITLGLWTNHNGREIEIETLHEEIGFSAIAVADFMALENIVWRELANELKVEFAIYELSPDLHAAKSEWTAQSRKPVWDKLLNLSPDIITTDFPREFSEYLQIRK